ncbi:hypothetical protein [Nonomuraea diastatica]|uniref:hypothetical protein n=1 Tax=Nonomuraea diastatica TaxID=1848329 RepID=UPI003CCC58BD
MPFAEIGAIMDRSPAAARQLASRARRRVRGATGASDTARSQKREIVDAFRAASRNGDFAALLELLDPDVVVGEIRGGHAVAAFFTRRAQAARPALVDGVPSAVWSHRGRPKAVFTFTVGDGDDHPHHHRHRPGPAPRPRHRLSPSQRQGQQR